MLTSPLLRRAALAGFAAFTLPAAAQPISEIAYQRGAGPVRTTLPAAAQPLPVVVILPNWHPAEGRNQAYARPLHEAGIATLTLEPVGVNPERLAEALAVMLRAAATDPRFDGQRIGILGLGVGARAALAGGGTHPVAAVLPGCASLEAAPQGPVLLVDGADVTQPREACAQFRASLGGDAAYHAYSGATHAWDFVAADWWDHVLWLPPHHAARPESEALADAAEAVARFMIQALRPSPRVAAQQQAR